MKQYSGSRRYIGPMQSKLVEQSSLARPRIHWTKRPFQSTYGKLIQLLYLYSASAAANGVILYLSTSTSFKTPIEAKCFSMRPEQMSALPALITPCSADKSRGLFTHRYSFGRKVGTASPRSVGHTLFKHLQSDSDPKNGVKSTLYSTAAIKAMNSLVFTLTSANAILIIVSAGVSSVRLGLRTSKSSCLRTPPSPRLNRSPFFATAFNSSRYRTPYGELSFVSALIMAISSTFIVFNLSKVIKTGSERHRDSECLNGQKTLQHGQLETGFSGGKSDISLHIMAL